MKKILLINPCTPLIWKKQTIRIINNLVNPYSLSIIASTLKKEFSVEVLDANILRLNQKKVIAYAHALKPDVIILASASMDRWQCPIPADDYFLDILKMTTCEKIVFGPHITMNPQRYFEYADKIIIGEPEAHFPEIVNSGGGICDKKFVDDLDSLPYPAYELLPMKKYKNRAVITSRGCPFKCIFCYKGMWGEEYRSRTEENIIEELRLLKEKYCVDYISFWDLEFTLDKERVKRLCERIIEEKLNIGWFANVRVSSVSLDMLKLMKRAGCVSLGIGIESGCDRVLRTIKKGITKEQASEAVKIARKAKIDFVYSTPQIGFPGETQADIAESYQFFKKIDNDNIFCITAIPYLGTELNTIGDIGPDLDDVVVWTGRVGNNIDIKRTFFFMNLKLFLNRITCGLPKLIRFAHRSLKRTLSNMLRDE